MDARFINPFLKAATNVIETMAFTQVTAGKPHLKPDKHSFGAITGLIGVAGDKIAGNLIVSFDEASILAIVNKMIGEQFTSISQDVVDAVGEITNMICGGAKNELAEQGFTVGMATPVMIVGKGIELNQLSKAPVITIPFTTPEGAFVVEANLAPK